MELKEKLELLNEKSSVTEIQKYIKDMKKARKFDGVTIEREMMLFVEEIGELAKAWVQKVQRVYWGLIKL